MCGLNKATVNLIRLNELIFFVLNDDDNDESGNYHITCPLLPFLAFC